METSSDKTVKKAKTGSMHNESNMPPKGGKKRYNNQNRPYDKQQKRPYNKRAVNNTQQKKPFKKFTKKKPVVVEQIKLGKPIQVFAGHKMSTFIMIPVKTFFLGLFLTKESKILIKNFIHKNKNTFKSTSVIAEYNIVNFTDRILKLFRWMMYDPAKNGSVTTNFLYMFHKARKGAGTQLYFCVNLERLRRGKYLNVRQVNNTINLNILPVGLSADKIEKKSKKLEILVKDFRTNDCDVFHPDKNNPLLTMIKEIPPEWKDCLAVENFADPKEMMVIAKTEPLPSPDPKIDA